MIKDKLKASGTHFFFSAVIIFAFVALAYYVWFTPAFFTVLGALTPLKILVLVDVVIGPLLTFVVYKKGKKTLKMDMAVIILIQVAALVYGAYSTYQGRPVLMYMDENSYGLVLQKDLQEVRITQPELQTGPFNKPKIGVIPDLDTDPLTLMQYKVNTTVPVNSDNAQIIIRRQIRDMAVIERLTKLDEAAFLQKLKDMHLDFEQHLFHMVSAQDFLHLLISDPETLEPLALISDPTLMNSL